jgi:hypothetical protein
MNVGGFGFHFSGPTGTTKMKRKLLDYNAARIAKWVPLMIVMMSVPACATHLKTDVAFHELALDPAERENRDARFDLPFDAFIIGVEKANRSQVGAIKECGASGGSTDCLNIDAPFFTQRPELRDNLRAKYNNQHRPTLISHIAQFDSAASCFTYNIYSVARQCPAASSIPRPANGEYVDASWKALADLETRVASYVAQRNPSHILVYVMGWNTPQWEAMRNFRDLHQHLIAAAKASENEAFRPLFIGITWPSTGTPIIAASDFGIKAKDADEVGAIWGNILINRVLARVKHDSRVRIVVVGHSFGARLSSRAVFSAPLVRPEDERTVDLLIGLQGAYSFQRYVAALEKDAPEGVEGAPYSAFQSMVGKVALTSSPHDTAVTRAKHRNYFVGSYAVYEKTAKPPYAALFEHAKMNSDGSIELRTCDPSKVLFVDASRVIDTNFPGTGGGAHSDIYDPEIGRFTYQLIQLCAR